jgi:hypothetical protein
MNTDMMWYLFFQSRCPHRTSAKCISQKLVHVTYSDTFRFHSYAFYVWVILLYIIYIFSLLLYLLLFILFCEVRVI